MYKLTRMEAETIRRTDQDDWDIHELGKNANRLYIHACRNPNLWDKYGDNTSDTENEIDQVFKGKN